MSVCDEKFIETCKRILSEGDENTCRAKWGDGTHAKTLFITNVVNEYDVGKEFPMLTLRKQPISGPVKEVLWIYQQKSNNVNDLGLHIWDQWADNNGSIGRAYGFQIGKPYVHHQIKELTKEERENYEKYPSYHIDIDSNTYNLYVLFDQMDAVLYDLRNDPFSRRIMTNTYNYADLYKMGLYPCAYSTTWSVYKGKLNLLLNQRSQDMLAANAWNVMQYSALLVMVAKATGYEPGKLTHVIGNCHIYDKHLDIIKELIERQVFNAPTVKFTNDSTDFYSYKADDFVVENYKYGDPVGKFEVAV